MKNYLLYKSGGRTETFITNQNQNTIWKHELNPELTLKCNLTWYQIPWKKKISQNGLINKEQCKQLYDLTTPKVISVFEEFLLLSHNI